MDEWVEGLLADPITKKPRALSDFPFTDGVVDARVYLTRTGGFEEWKSGQNQYEAWLASAQGYRDGVQAFIREIAYDRPIYERFPMGGVVLDVGGGIGTVREFLPAGTRFVSLDPYLSVIREVPPAQVAAYGCLAQPLNFICGIAEFLPFRDGSFDWVHMRSMLDHVQVPDLALIEARRVLGPDGQLLVGMTVEGGKSGRLKLSEATKEVVRHALGAVGIDRWADHHTWHPTYRNLKSLIEAHGFSVVEEYWQPHWAGKVVYLRATCS